MTTTHEQRLKFAIEVIRANGDEYAFLNAAPILCGVSGQQSCTKVELLQAAAEVILQNLEGEMVVSEEFRKRRQELGDRIEALKALSVTRIMIDVVSDPDGQTHEIYAQSVADVESTLTKLCEQVDVLEAKLAQSQGALKRHIGTKSSSIESMDF